MSLASLELRHLRYFVAVVEQRSFRGASLRLHVSQPPLTRQVHQLEEALGVRLLLRKPRGVETTDAGAVFFEEARNILMLTAQAADRARLAGQGHLGRLDVGVFGSAVLDTIPRIIQQFRKAYPLVEVVLHSLDREAQIRALRERRLTVGFNRFVGEDPEIARETILTERLLVAVPEHHRLATHKSLRLKQLDGEPMIFYPRAGRPNFIDHLLRLFGGRGLVPKVVQEVDDVVTAVSLVSSGLGLSMVVESALNLRLPGVVYLPLHREDRASFDLHLIYRRGEDSRLLQAFLDVVRALKRKTAATRPRR